MTAVQTILNNLHVEKTKRTSIFKILFVWKVFISIFIVKAFL